MSASRLFEPARTPGDLAAFLNYKVRPGGPNRALEQERELGLDAPWFEHLRGFVVRDRRDEPRDKRVKRGRPRHPRLWSDIIGTTAHQTASGFLHAGHSLILGIPAHVILHRDASFTLLHYFTRRMPHAHALNTTVGVEVDCREPGLLDDPETAGLEDALTFWRKKKEKANRTPAAELIKPCTAPMLRALSAILRCTTAAIAFNTDADTHSELGIFMHRQGGPRESDGGERIARHCDEVRLELGLQDFSTRTFGKGVPQPDQWVGRNRGIPYR